MNLPRIATTFGLIACLIAGLGVLLWGALDDLPSRSFKARRRAISLCLFVIAMAVVNLLINEETMR